MLTNNSTWDMNKQQYNTVNHSAECLRKAVPLMVKYNIAVTPANYALWYTYVSGKHPNLNDKLNEALKTFGTCPPALSRELFEEFLSDKDLELYDEVALEVDKLVQNMNADIIDTLDHTKEFSHALSECNNSLTGMQAGTISTDAILDLVCKLSDESQAMQQTASLFQTKLDIAHKEISRLRIELQKTKQDANHDALTGLLNRGSFDEDIDALCQNQNKQNRLFLTFVDIDHFKQFNDDFGHQKGDQVLKIVAKMLKNKCNLLNTVYRFGGEEFCIISQNSDPKSCAEFVESLRVAIERLAVKDSKTGKNLRKISASFGIAEYLNDSPANLIEQADRAVYNAKQQGRNRIEFYRAKATH